MCNEGSTIYLLYRQCVESMAAYLPGHSDNAQLLLVCYVDFSLMRYARNSLALVCLKRYVCSFYACVVLECVNQ
jgi:hypothetical protein